MNQQTKQLMDMSDRVGELSDIAVKDIYVRQKLFKKRMDELEQKARIEGVSVTDLGGFDTAREAFKVNGSISMFHELSEMLRLSAYGEVANSDSPATTLFDMWTNGDMSEQKRVRKAREWIAHYTSGCVGTFGSDVLRTNVRKWGGSDGK